MSTRWRFTTIKTCSTLPLSRYLPRHGKNLSKMRQNLPKLLKGIQRLFTVVGQGLHQLVVFGKPIVMDHKKIRSGAGRKAIDERRFVLAVWQLAKNYRNIGMERFKPRDGVFVV